MQETEYVINISDEEKNLLSKRSRSHFDTTNFSVHGEYNVYRTGAMVEVTHGFSKDHRPDLQQVPASPGTAVNRRYYTKFDINSDFITSCPK
jgi:transposase